MRKKVKKYLSILLFIILAFLLSCCTRSASQVTTPMLPSNSPTPIVPERGMGAIMGRIANGDEFWPNKPIHIFAAQFYGDEGGEGAFVLEPTLFPSTEVDSRGYFQINNMPPRKYVLVVGPSAEGGVLIKVGEETQVYEVVRDMVTDIGTIFINP